ncbi:polysaccharide deacetylase family protein [Capnocytophaga sp. oral taxon 864]|uniref:polysaccharide deacetylase family protein n=1 Tax=Capnocytophaga sp. oral taxon 864 TaxID=1316593 RepID=UPI000D036904|nr:polysaccharide deacetylase family protein [Capnocytophaga sp. oral taxon 864]AVM55786.1 polysaccharide deacetylase [Capnocytophaga sp. oral taxon 864]
MENQNLTVVMYHYVRDLKHSRYPSIKGLDVALFKEQVAFLKKHYSFVTVEEVIAATQGIHKLPSHPVLLTFDDAYIDHFTYVFPILKNEGVQGAFYAPVKAITQHKVLDVNKIHFILTSTPEEKMSSLLKEIALLLDKYREVYHLESFEFYYKKLAQLDRFDTKEVIFVKRLLQVELVEKLRNIITTELFKKIVGVEEGTFSRELYMSEDQMKYMVSAGMHIGSHGYDHYWLGSLPKEKQEVEIKESLKFIENIGGDIKHWTICYPYGNYNDDTITLLKENHCALGFTTEVKLADINNQMGDNVFKIPRLDTNDLPKDAKALPNNWYK